MADPVWDDTEPTWDGTEEAQSTEVAPKWEDTDEAPVSKLESGLRGVAAGLSMGWADELSGAAQAGIEKLKGSDLPISDLYSQERDKYRELYRKAEEANPGIYTSGEIAGGVGSSFIPGLNVAKGAGLATMAGKAALQSGIQSLGSADKLAPDAETAKDIALGAGMGTLGGAIAKPFSKASEALESGSIQKSLKDYANEKAALALGATKRDLKTQKGLENALKMGRQGLDQEVVTVGANTEDMLSKVGSIKGEAKQALNSIMEQIDTKGLSQADASTLREQVIKKLEEVYGPEALGDLSNKISGLGNQGIDVITGQSGKIPLKDIQDLKKTVSQIGYPGGKMPISPTEKQSMYQDAKRLLDEQIQQSTAKASGILGEDTLAAYNKAKSQYGFGKEAEKRLMEKSAGETVGGLKSSINDAIDTASVVAAPFTAGKSLSGLGIRRAGEALIDKRNQIAAVGADKLGSTLGNNADRLSRYADILAKTSQTLPKATTSAVSTLQKPTTVDSSDTSDQSIDSLIQKVRNEGLGEELVQTLENIKSMNNQDRTRAMISIKTQPAFRSLMKRE